MTVPIAIDIWSDIACPWCYIGKRRMEAALKEYAEDPDALPVTVAYHSFQLMPDLPASYPGSQREYLAERKGLSLEQVDGMNQQVVAAAASVGLDYDMDAIQVANTVGAHQLLHLAKAHGKQSEAKERLLAAYFVEGRHLGRTDELVALARDVGLDGEDAAQALTEERYRDAVHADAQLAQQLGAHAVPFFVLDRTYGISGAQEPAQFLQVLRTVTAKRQEQPDSA